MILGVSIIIIHVCIRKGSVGDSTTFNRPLPSLDVLLSSPEVKHMENTHGYPLFANNCKFNHDTSNRKATVEKPLNAQVLGAVGAAQTGHCCVLLEFNPFLFFSFSLISVCRLLSILGSWQMSTFGKTFMLAVATVGSWRGVSLGCGGCCYHELNIIARSWSKDV